MHDSQTSFLLMATIKPYKRIKLSIWNAEWEYLVYMRHFSWMFSLQLEKIAKKHSDQE